MEKIPAFDETNEDLVSRWDSLSQISAEVQFKIAKLNDLLNQYHHIKETIQQKALQSFKDNQKLNFMNKYAEQIKTSTFSNEMFREMTRIEESEQYGCYQLDGIKVYKRDCGLCSRHCKVKQL